MKRALNIIFLTLFVCTLLSAEEFTRMVSLVKAGDIAVFETTGIGDKQKEVEANAQKAIFDQLFFVGVEGVNNGKPLVVNKNVAYTNSFFNSQNRYAFYIDQQKTTLIGKLEKVGSTKQGRYHISVRLTRLMQDMRQNKVLVDGIAALDAKDVENEENMVLPTVMVVPYAKQGENLQSILENDYDRRVAVSSVQNGFEQKHVTTVDLQAKINATRRRQAYDTNAANAESNDKQLLLTSGADVYVTVDLNKDIQPSGSRVTLILKAYETASGNVLSSKTATPTRRYQTSATDALCKYTVEDNIEAFLQDIMRNFTPAAGGRVVMTFSIAGTSATTMNDPMGRQGYSLSNIIRQWVRKNAYMGKYHLQGIVDESMIFDYVTIPPKDEDGLRMDAAQFAFILEQYLKETEGIECSTRVDGNNILVTIF